MIRLAHPELGPEELAAVAAVFESGFLVQGARVLEFEARVADYLGVAHAVAVSSGTAALHLAALALGLGPGDEVLVPDFTYPATANAVRAVGATPVLVDVDPATFNLDVAEARRKVTPRTRAIVPVHEFGLAADMTAVLQLALAHGLRVIEDAACALGAEHLGARCGTIGDAGCFSFHPRKSITTGEGGMIVTANAALAGDLRMLRNHGMVASAGRMVFERSSLNHRLTDFQGAMGVVQMGRLDGLLARRRALAEVYAGLLRDLHGVTAPAAPPGYRHAWQSYVVLLAAGVDRDRVREHMAGAGVETTLGSYSLGAQPAFAAASGDCPRSQACFRRSLALPMHARLEPADVEAVVQALAAAIARAA